MSITLESLISGVVDKNVLISMQVERARRPTATANFARNGSKGYVVVEAPGNIEGFLMDNFAKDERDLLSVYDMEEEERVRGHNERERQKLKEWERESDRLIKEWQEGENRRIPEWQEGERVRREEYDLELAIKQEEAEKAGLGYAGLVFDALENRGKNVGPIRDQYMQQGFLSDLRKRWLDTYLTRDGIDDEGVRKEIIGLTNSKDPVLSDRLREILIERLKVKFPDVSQLLPPYKPEPILDPEPKPKLERPDLGTKPKLELKVVTPLLQELESVVLAAYKGKDLESLSLTQQAWNDAGIVPQEMYGRIRGNVRFLNGQYMMVRVIGNSDGNIGSLALVELDANHKGGLRQSVPNLLRSSFQRPTELVEDAYALSLILWPKVEGYLEAHERDNEVFSNAKTKEDVHLSRAIYKAILGRTTPLIADLFPELTKRDVGENMLSKYEGIVQEVKKAFDKGLLDTYDIPYDGKNIRVSANELVSIIRYLVDFLPEELFELRHQTTMVDWAERTVRSMPLVDKRHRRLNPSGVQYVEGVKVVGSSAQEIANSLISQLGILAEGRKSEWKLNAELGFSAATNVLNRYGISYTIGYANHSAGK